MLWLRMSRTVASCEALASRNLKNGNTVASRVSQLTTPWRTSMPVSAVANALDSDASRNTVLGSTLAPVLASA